MLTLKFIFKKAADKFVDDVESDLRKYKDVLEKSSSPKAKRVLAQINAQLGIKPAKKRVVPERVEEYSERDWKKEREAKARLIKDEAQKALREHFENNL